MQVIINGSPEEVAALVAAMQERGDAHPPGSEVKGASLSCTSFQAERLAKDVAHMQLPDAINGSDIQTDELFSNSEFYDQSLVRKVQGYGGALELCQGQEVHQKLSRSSGKTPPES